VATEKLRAELEIITAKAEKDLKRLDRSLAGVEKKVASIGGKGGRSLKPLGEGLSAATVNASEFEKSMAAANARVIAFGASAGLIIQVQRALKETVRATIEVEKSLTDINVVLNTNTANLQKFGDSLFKIAGQTGQGFKTVAVAATELARQGLSMEKTLLRTKDALILTRLTGMGAEEAVSSLTAAVNSFSKAGITSAQVVNKMAKVDQAFAVSSDDLAKAISRVGSSAVDAGVSMDELLAITTAVQQRTARGGAVIGNAFKTIFTRIGRTDVQKKLAGIGVATRDMATGAMLPATKVLENLSAKFKDLSKVQQNQIAESVAGVFQVNILRAALGDLASKYGVYNRALKESASATDEAYQKNLQLNQTLDAMVNKTLANLTQAGAAIGGATLKPAIENVLSAVNAAIGAFGEGGRFEEFGKGIGKDLLEGVGKFLSGPGLAILTIGIGKLAINFASFAKTAVAGVLELNKNVLLRKNLEAQVTAELQRQPNIIKAIERGEMSAATAAKDMLAAMKATNVEATKLAATSRSISGAMLTLPGGRRPGRAAGFVPNFADPNAERGAAAMGGYRAGAIKTMNIPGQGNVMYNGAETVKQFPGMVQPAIMPPQRSLAGANYKKAFGAAHGFDPYAAGGFVPNFNRTIIDKLGANPSNAKIASAIRDGHLTRDEAIGLYSYKGTAGLNLTQAQKNEYNKKGTKDVIKESMDVQKQLGILSLYGRHKGVAKNATASMKIKDLAVFQEYVARNPEVGEERIQFTGVQVATLKGLEDKLVKEGGGNTFSDTLNDHIIEPLARVGAKTVGGILGNQGPRVSAIKNKMQGKNLVPKQAEGELFETAIKLALHNPKRFIDSIDGSPTAPFDFEEGKAPTQDFKTKLGFSHKLLRADAKRTSDKAAVDSIVKKAYNQHVLIEAGLAKGPLLKELGAVPLAGKIDQSAATQRLRHTAGKPGRAYGLVPNFSPLGDAITRERAAGVPKSAIRVGSSPALKGPGNPGGLGVYNTIDEPAGLGQGISRSRSMGINPKTHGVPNFAISMTPGAGAGIPIVLGPGGAGGYTKLPADYFSGVDRPDSAKSAIPPKIVDKIDDSSKTFKSGATKFAGAIDRLMIPLTAVGYMGVPAIERSYGAQAADTFQAGLGGVFAAQMAGTMASSGVNKLGEMIPRKPPKLDPVTGKIARSAKTARAFGKYGKMAAPVIAAAGTGYAAFAGLRTDPADIEHQETMQRLQERMDNLKGMGSGSAILSGAVGNIAQNYGTMTSSQVVKAHEDIGRQTDSMLEEIMASGQDVDTSEFQSAMEEFQKHMLSNATDLESAEEKASKAIQNLTDSITKLQKAALGEQKAEKLNKFFRDQEATIESFREFEKEGGNLADSDTAIKIFRRTMGDMIDTGALSDTRSGIPFLASAPTGFSNRAYAGAGSGNISSAAGSVLDKAQNALIDSLLSTKGALGFVNPLAYGGDLAGLFMDKQEGLMKEIFQEIGHFDINEMSPEFVRRFNKAMDEILLQGLTEKQKSFIGQISKDIDIVGAAKAFKEKEFKGMTDEVEIQRILDKRRDELKASDTPLADLKDLGIFDDEQAINKVIDRNLPDTVKMNIIDAFFKRFKASIIAYSNRPKNVDDFKRTVEDFTPLARRQQSLLGAAFQSKRALKDLKRRNDSAENLAKVQDDMALALARATKSAEGVAKVELDVSMERTRRKFDDLTEELEEQFSGQISEARAALVASQLKFSKKSPQQSAAAKQEAEMLQSIVQGADPRFASLPEGHPLRSKTIPLEARAHRMRSLIAEAQAKGGALADPDPNAAMQLEMRQRALKIIELRIQQADIEREYNEGRIDENTRNKKMAELKDLQLQLEHEYNREAAQRNLRIKASQTAGALQFIEGDLRAGKITGSSASAQRRAARQAQRDAFGLDPSKQGAGFAGFGTIVKESFARGPRDAVEEFEDGIADVALTIRDSLKDAIKNIASGAQSFEDAMFNIFAALADKIATQGINQGVDSIFGSLFGKKHGGYIPRGYNQGGVVTGGSGVRDDVMTMMQGGEYVIKKSAAQRIGYSTLNAINSYANGGKARVSLAKEFLYNEPTNRPTSGGFNISRNLSMQGIFNENDPQTGAMFDKSNRLDSYLNYRLQEQRRRDSIIQKAKQEKKARLMNAYVSAGLRIGAGFIGGNFGPTAENAAGAAGSTASNVGSSNYITPLPGPAAPGPGQYGYSEYQGARGGSPALVMGGEYIMSPRTTAKYGTGFMAELNRGRVPGFNEGGMVGGGGGGMSAGVTTNNVSLNINVGNDGSTKVESQSQDSKSSNQERQDKEEVERSKQFGDAVRSAVLKEIQRQQRPGGLLRDGATYAGGKRI
tara:strand:+ start:5150 stop:12163 length:7014 start_codon:yes stop_codon:yes gene_type:complete